MVLENAGYGVSVARSAEDADRMIRSLWPDIVLMDRELPGIDGLELTRRLKVAEETSGITIIAFSSLNSNADNELALSAGSDGFIHKPFTVRGLLQTIAWHVSARDNQTVVARASLQTAAVKRDDAPPAASDGQRRSAATHLFGGFMRLSRSMIMSGIVVMAAQAVSGTV